MTPPLARRALAECLGTALLVAVVVGSGAHFNPVVTLADYVLSRRPGRSPEASA